jgi:hypothetical protein
MTTENYINFWSKCTDLQEHPDDTAVLKAHQHTHQLQTSVLIDPWRGPIRTAPVILLTLNGGLVGNGEEAVAAQMPAARASMTHNLTGNAPLPNWEGNPAGRGWTERRLNAFGLTYRSAADKVAFVNLISYKSRDGALYKHMASLLPSSRATAAWMRDTIFPEAEAGRRTVVCLVSHRHWTLVPGTKRGKALYAPHTNRRYDLLYDQKSGPTRQEIEQAIRRAVFHVQLGSDPG